MSARLRLGLAALAAFALLATACGDDDGDGDDGASETTSAPAETTTTGPAEEMEASPVTAEFQTLSDAADPANDPVFPPGSSAAWWYTAGDVYAVVYTGVDPDVVGPTCPGNSLQLADNSFDFISNAPLSEGDCGPIEVDPNVEARLCEGTIVYTTVIPVDAEGVLVASFGGVEAGQGAGQAGVATNAAATPELDPSADAFAFPDEMGGPVTC